ncbi:unnamed protein product [Urochloa humidicola]
MHKSNLQSRRQQQHTGPFISRNLTGYCNPDNGITSLKLQGNIISGADSVYSGVTVLVSWITKAESLATFSVCF